MGTGRKKIEMKKVEDMSRRLVSFSKRKKGLFRKAQELQTLTGCKVGCIVFSPAQKPFTDGDLSVIRHISDNNLTTAASISDSSVRDPNIKNEVFECNEVCDYVESSKDDFWFSSGLFEDEEEELRLDQLLKRKRELEDMKDKVIDKLFILGGVSFGDFMGQF